MNLKTTFVIFGLLICLLFIFGIVVERTSPPDEGWMFPDIHDAVEFEVESVVLEKEGKKYTIKQDEKGNWILSEGKEVWRLEKTKIEDIIEDVRTARKNELADVAEDPEKAGLTDPRYAVTLRTGKGAGKQYTLTIGNQSGDELNVFVKSSERPREIFAVEKASLKPVMVDDIRDLRSRTLLEVDAQNATYIDVTKKGEDEENELVIKQTDKGLWRFVKPKYGFADFEGPSKEKDKEAVSVKSLINAVGSIKAEENSDFVKMGNRSMEDFGLDGNETLRIQAKWSEGFGESKKILSDTLLVGARKKDSGEYYVRLIEDKFVVLVDEKKLDAVFKALAEPEKLRSKDLTHVAIDEPDAINILWPDSDTEVKLRKEAEGTLWKMYVDGEEGQLANQTAIDGEKGLIDVVKANGKIEQFIDDQIKDKELGFDEPNAIIELYIDALAPKKQDKNDNGKKDDKKNGDKAKDHAPPLKEDAKPAVKLIFGKPVDLNVYVKRIDGQGHLSRVKVPRSIYKEVKPSEGYLAFLNNELPGFDPAEVTKLELDQGAETFVLEYKEKKKEQEDKKKKDEDKKTEDKDGEKDPDEEEAEKVWKRIQPADLKKQGIDNANLQKVLSNLSALEVVKWVKKVDPEEDDLKEFGLDDPVVQAAVTVEKGKDKTEKVYQFGKEEEGELGKTGKVFALAGGTDIVFLTDKKTVEFLRGVELRGRKVLDFKTEDVEKLTLEGWNHVYKDFTPTLTISRTGDDEWKARVGDDEFELDPAKADQLVTKLSQTYVKRYVDVKGGPTKAQKLVGKSRDIPLEIKIKLKDVKEPLTLTIGALNKEKTGYFAQVSELPKEVVILLPKDDFEDLWTKGPKHLKPRSEEEDDEQKDDELKLDLK